MKKKIVVLDGFLVNHDQLGWKLDDLHDVTWYDYTKKEEMLTRIGNADAIYVNRLGLGTDIFEACPRLQFVGILGTGYNMIDLEAAKKAEITVCNVPAYSTQSVAQAVFALLLNIYSQTYRQNAYVHSGSWQNPVDPGLVATPMFELSGKTIGILGYGNIGRGVATIAQAFGMNVLANRRNPDPSEQTDTFRYVELDELFAASDVISVHCPLTNETRGLINAQTIAKMKDGVVIINTARGPVVNEEDMAAALNSKKVYMYGADVLSAEPAGENRLIACHERTVVTPHTAWMPVEARRRCLDIAAANYLAFLEGHPQNVVR